MNTTIHKILEILSQQPSSAKNLREKIGVSESLIHRHLKKLTAENKIYKVGTPPKVEYFLTKKSDLKFSSNFSIMENLEKKYLEKFSLTNWQKKLPKRNKTVTNYFNFYQSSSAVFSAKIEGNTLDLNSFLNQSNAAQSQKNKQVLEIEDLCMAYDFAKNNKLTIENFLKAHRISTKNILSQGLQGVFRSQPVGVFGESGLVYMAIEPEFVEKEINKLFEAITANFKKKNPSEIFFLASFAHLRLAHIHPFMDGNGRMARLLEKWILAENISEEFWTLESEKIYFKNRRIYYENLNLGVNFYELKYEKSFPFLSFLPQSISES